MSGTSNCKESQESCVKFHSKEQDANISLKNYIESVMHKKWMNQFPGHSLGIFGEQWENLLKENCAKSYGNGIQNQYLQQKRTKVQLVWKLPLGRA